MADPTAPDRGPRRVRSVDIRDPELRRLPRLSLDRLAPKVGRGGAVWTTQELAGVPRQGLRS
jgi:hypothetical protein